MTAMPGIHQAVRSHVIVRLPVALVTKARDATTATDRLLLRYETPVGMGGLRP